MRVAIIGGVHSTARTLKALVRHGFCVEKVLGYEPKDASLVSGYADLKELSTQLSLPYQGFRRIQDHENLVASLEIDFLFVVGLSQLVSQKIIEAPRVGAVGFHPTDLPRGRGRAPLAWLVHEQQSGAACFFGLQEQADAGPILVKEPFEVTGQDDAGTVEIKLLDAMDRALDRWLPELLQGHWDPQPQEEALATEFGVRRPEDGLLDFAHAARVLDRRIKAAAPPHPGAFTFYRHQKLRVLAARLEPVLKIRGCCGRVLKVREDWHLVQTGNGLIWVRLELDGLQGPKPSVGQRLGYVPQLEIYDLHQKVDALAQELKRGAR